MPPLLPPPDTRDLPCRDGCTPMWSAASWDSSVPVDTAASTASASFSEPSPSEPTTTTCKPAFWLPSLLNNLSTYDTLTLSAGSCRDLAKLASNVDVRLGVKASASMPTTSRFTTTAVGVLARPASARGAGAALHATRCRRSASGRGAIIRAVTRPDTAPAVSGAAWGRSRAARVSGRVGAAAPIRSRFAGSGGEGDLLLHLDVVEQCRAVMVAEHAVHP